MNSRGYAASPRATGVAKRPAWLELRQPAPQRRSNQGTTPSDLKRIPQLETQAEQALQQGNADLAFQRWFESLRLRQQQPPREEIQALAQVGETAWERNRSLEVQAIKARLDQLAARLRRDGQLLQPETLRDLALAYRRIRDLTQAEALYRERLIQAQQTRQVPEEQQLLNSLGQIKLEQLDYTGAVPVYQALIKRLAAAPKEAAALSSAVPASRTSPPTPAAEKTSPGSAAQVAPQPALSSDRSAAPRGEDSPPFVPLVLNQLAFAQEKAGQFQAATLTLKQLRPLLPPERQTLLDLAIARNQQQAGDLVTAVQTYQDTYRQAQKQGQLGLARDSLTALSVLYRQRQQLDDALVVDQLLLALSRQTYDFYGQVDAYLKLTRLYLQQGQTAAAAAALHAAQNLASQLGYASPQLRELEQALEQAKPTPKQ